MPTLKMYDDVLKTMFGKRFEEGTAENSICFICKVFFRKQLINNYLILLRVILI